MTRRTSGNDCVSLQVSLGVCGGLQAVQAALVNLPGADQQVLAAYAYAQAYAQATAAMNLKLAVAVVSSQFTSNLGRQMPWIS